MKNFYENRPLIEHEFEKAKFDESTGISSDEMFNKLQEIQNQPTDLPRQIVCANTYAWILDNVQLEINENTPFSVKFNIGVDYSDFASTDIFDKTFFQKQREKIVKEMNPSELEQMYNGAMSLYSHVWTDFWHTVPNWNYLLENGFIGILKNAQSSKEKLLKNNSYSEKQIVFLDSVIICYKAIIKFLNRIYDYSLKFNTPKFSAGIKSLTKNPPQTLYEAMLFSVLYLYFEEIGCERGRTLGSIDRMYYPFYEDAIKKGVSQEEIKELFRYFFIHFTATKRFAEQPLCIGGGDKEGKDFSNELTMLILDVYDELDIYDPKLHLRYHKNIDDKVYTKVISMIRKGHSSICILNDEAVFKGYERLGIPVDDAQEYVLLGCYEPVIQGKEEAEIGISWINLAKILELTLNDGKDMITGKQLGCESNTAINSFEDFLNSYLNQLDYCIDFAIDFAEKQGLYSKMINPSPIYSSSFCECIEKGMDVHEYPLKYNNMSFKIFALATTVDSLVAIKKYVYDKEEISLGELIKALKIDWNGYEELRERILKDTEKYGNNLETVDKIMCEVTNHIRDRYLGKKLQRGGKLRIGMDSIDHCISMGKNTAATPDGRKKGDVLSKNGCAVNGMDRKGITAYMNSFLKIDIPAFLNAAILDFYLHPSSVNGEKGLKDFKSLIKIFFDAGGFAVQGNVLSSQTLVDAQQNPEKYRNLQVRVCGWNEYFVKMSKEKQDMFIKQFEETEK